MRKPLALTLTTLITTAIGVASAGASTDWDRAVAAYKAGDHTEAVAAFTRYVAQMPDAYQGHQMLGTALLRSGDAAKAAESLRRADELNPGQPAILLTLGQALLGAENTAGACSVLGRIATETLEPRYAEPLFGLRARAACSAGLTDLRQLAEASNTADALASYGVAAQRAKEYSIAVDALSKASALAPTNIKVQRAEAIARTQLALAKAGAARVAEYGRAKVPARAVYGAAVSTAAANDTPVDTSAVVLYADILIGANELGTAATVLNSAAAATPEDWSVNYLQGSVYLLEDDFAAATAPLERSLVNARTESETRQSSERLGFAYEKLRRYGDAILAYERTGDAKAIARVKTNRAIALENDEADEFNRRRAELIEQQQAADAALAQIREGGPPPTPN